MKKARTTIARATRVKTEPADARLPAWLAACGRPTEAAIDHAEIDGFAFGAPLIDDDAREALSDPMRKRIPNLVAVERSVYAGLCSSYAMQRASDCSALLAGLAHGFTAATLRLVRDSLERCVENDAWRLADCQFWESRDGAWRKPPAVLRNALGGKDDRRCRWSAQIFAPSAPLLGFAAYRLTLAVRTSRKSRRASSLEVEIDSIDAARRAAAAIAKSCDIEIPRAERKGPSAGSPALIWPEGTTAPKARLPREQWARGLPTPDGSDWQAQPTGNRAHA